MFAWKPFLAALLTVALGLVVVASVEWSYQRAETMLTSMKVSDASRTAAETVLRGLTDAEVAQRGTLLTGQEHHRQRFNQAADAVAAALEQLKVMYAGQAAFAPQLDNLDLAVDAKLAELRLALRWHGDGLEAAWLELLASGDSLARTEAARQSVNRLIQHIEAIADQKDTAVLRTLNLGRMAVHLATLMSAIWLVFFLRNNAALQRSQQAHAQDIADERDQLETQVTQRTQELAHLNLHLQTLREGERGMLARSLHDELGAALTAAKLDVARLRRTTGEEPPAWQQRLQHLAQSIDEGIAIKRRVIEDLMPSALHNLGLRPALEILVNQFRRDTGVETHLSVADIETNQNCRNAIFQVVQESLRNITLFANASTVQVIVGASTDAADVVVRDDGVGFDLKQLGLAVEAPGRGLNRLRYRVELAGGRFAVFSAPGRGTEIHASIPLAQS